MKKLYFWSLLTLIIMVVFLPQVANAQNQTGQPCPGTPTVTDIDGNVYNTVRMGSQCWMKENLRTTKYADGTTIPSGYDFVYTFDPYYSDYSSSDIPLEARGYLYNWRAAMHSTLSSNTVPSGVQGVCPNGWHLPSNSEWTVLTDYVSSQPAYICDGETDKIAKALTSTMYWVTVPDFTMSCAIGHNPSTNNATGFSIVPAGEHQYGSNPYTGTGWLTGFWSSTKSDDNSPLAFCLYFIYDNEVVVKNTNPRGNHLSVRCLRDENIDTTECFNDCYPDSCGEYGFAMYTATQRLCHLDIVEGINGALQPDTNITRAQLAKVALYGLYNGPHNVPDSLVSDFFPSIYPDLQVDTAYYYRPAKALLYLEYGDGVSPFDRDRSVFNPSGKIERCLVLKVLLETFNIAPVSDGTSAFDDYGPSGYTSSKFWGYAQKAYDLGIVQTTHFRPNEYCTRGEAFLYLYRILTSSSINRPTPVNTEDPATSDFFIPTNLNPKVVNAMHGLENGNFNYYEKDFFNIPGYMNLDFGVSYNSYLTEMPDDFYPVKPLGKAWTHTYDMYMNIVTDPYHNNSVLVFHMHNGSLLMYKNVNGTLTSMTEGNYYDLTTSGSNRYILKSMDQISYTFERKSTSDGIYYLTQIKDRNNNAIDITYSLGDDHYRISSVSTLGRTLNFHYTTGTDLLYYVNDPIDRNVYFYYTDEQLSSLKDAKSQTTYFTYGTSDAEKGLLTEITLPRGNKVYNGYQQRKLVSMRRVNNSNSYTHTAVSISPNYQNGSTSSTVTTNLNGNQSLTTNYTMNGNNRITNINDGLHNDMSYEYNVSGKPDLVSKASDNKTSMQTTFSYNNKGLPTTVSVSAGGTTRTTNITYTSLNDVHQYTDANGNTTTYNYTNGNLTSVVDALGNTTTIVNNSQGKPTQVTDPSGVVMNFTYNSYGNETRQSIPSISTYFDRTYDGVSRVTSAKTSCDCQTTTYTYDNNDNMLTETDALNHTTTYTYDANDNVTKITDAKGNATNLTYDANDFLTSVSAQGASRSYTYNRDGSVATFTNPNGNTFNYSYNSSGELLNDGYASYNYNNKGQLVSVTKDNKAITFSYDAFGRISSTAYNNKTISYTYDNNDNILTMTYPGNKTVTYTYDALNRMTSVKDWNNATTTYNYRDDGQLSFYQYPNGVRTTYGYDGGGRMISQTSKRSNGSGTVVASYNYTWDEFGNHTQESFTEPYTEYPSTLNSATNYSYNNANRLTAAGNLTFGYDNNGNTTSRTGRTYSYDTKDNLTSASGDFSASYTYDGLGNRRSATRNGVTRQYVLDLLGSMSNVLMETDGSGNALFYYVYGANGLVSRIDANNDTRYYVYDYRGSTVAMTDATNAATVTHKYQYDDFGKVLQSEEADANPFRYVGQLGVMYEDDALAFMRARYYDPEIGRFLSEDPIWSTNLYPYADNNPIVYLDPKGEKPKCQKYYEKTNKWLGRLQTFGKNERRLEKLNEFAEKYSMNCLSGRDSNGNLQIAPLMSVGSKNGWGGGGKNEPWMNKYSTYELEELQKGNYKNIQIK
ncbi:MAG: S-layer homology domain-containing protein [Bacteroidales bacterium]|nr:S-layer homology domain-containing protein [Bacteroidales bacterium]